MTTDDKDIVTVTDSEGDTVSRELDPDVIDVDIEPDDTTTPPDPEPEPEPELGPDPDPATQTGVLFWWRPRVSVEVTAATALAAAKVGAGVVEYAKIPYRRTLILADGSSHPGYNDGDRDSYRATQTHLDNPEGDHIARVVLAGGYTNELGAIVLDDAFSDHTKYWYNLDPYDGEGTEGNDIPVREGAGPGDNAPVDLRLVHRPTGTVIDARLYSQLFDVPGITHAITEEADDPFEDVGRADTAQPHTVYQRRRLTIWYQGMEAHNYYFDSMHPDYYWHTT